MNRKHKAAAAATMAALLGAAGTAHAAFQGRLANGAPSSTCTVSGATKCTYFYDTTLDITILNNWNIGTGEWSPSAAPGSAQRLAAAAGFNASGLSGWVLPTGNGSAPAGASNQYLSIWNAVGGTFAGLSSQFDLVRTDFYWSGSGITGFDGAAWQFRTDSGGQDIRYIEFRPARAVAVFPGDIAAVPEPQTYALMLMGVGAVLLARRRRAT
jgi:hypothetical protein